MPRLKLLIAYEGTDFHGWQRQDPPGKEPLRTVQGVMESVAGAVLGHPVRVAGASRTDTGVHARGQVAALDTNTAIPTERVARAINSRLPEDVEVLSAEVVGSEFEPVTHATSKCYRYSLLHGAQHSQRAPIFERRFVAVTVHRLDVARMQAVAACFVGTHDFRAFAHDPDSRETTVRSVHSCLVRATDAQHVVIEISGSGFLHHMVRIISGTLLEAGRGRIEPNQVFQALETRDRTLAGPTMPPDGLCLEWIHYGPRN